MATREPPAAAAEDKNNITSEPMDTDLEKPQARHSRVPFFSRAHILGPVKKDHGDLPLLAMSFVTGLVDAASFRNWGMFIGMQTGS
jgi:hypothetical protein